MVSVIVDNRFPECFGGRRGVPVRLGRLRGPAGALHTANDTNEVPEAAADLYHVQARIPHAVLRGMLHYFSKCLDGRRGVQVRHGGLGRPAGTLDVSYDTDEVPEFAAVFECEIRCILHLVQDRIPHGVLLGISYM